MTAFIIIRIIHFIGILLVASTLFSELLLVGKTNTRKELQRISRIDGVYGAGALITVTAGLFMWFWVGKPAEFYNANPLLHLKVTLFVIVGILSIWPTIFFIKQRKGDPEEQVTIPSKIRNIIHIELFIVFLLPILAVLMALGIGSNS